MKQARLHNNHLNERDSLDWSNENVGDRGQVLTDQEVGASGEVRLEGGDVRRDLPLVQQVVLGNSRDQLGLVCEDRGPALDGAKVILHVLARVQLLWHLEADKEQVKHALSDIVPAASLEVTDGSHELLVHLGCARVASLKLGQVVLSCHTVDEASQDVVDHAHIDVLSVTVVGERDELGWGGSDQSHSDISDVLTSIKILGGRPVSLLLCDLSFDSLTILEVIESEGLTEGLWILEDRSPLFNSLQVVLHGKAWLEVFLQVENKLLEVQESLEKVNLLKIGDEVLNVRLKLGSALVACLNLWKFHVTRDTVDKTGDEFRNHQDVEILSRCFDRSYGLSKSKGGILACIKVVTRGPISAFFSEILLDCPSVQKPILGQRLGECLWLSEDRSPALNRGDVIIHVLACSQGFRELVDDLANFG